MKKRDELFCVFLGPDGSGKSSLIDKFNAFRRALHPEKRFVKFHWRPGMLPQIRTLLGKSKLENEFVIAHPHSPKKRSRTTSFLRWMYYSIDYIIGYYLKILPMKIRTTAVIMDRYYYDIIVDPVRYGFNLPKWLLKLPLRFIPQPDLTIYLDNEPEELYKRKQELPVSELKRQVEAWREFIPSLPNARIVTTDKPLEDVVHEVTKLVLERRAEMTRGMLKIEPEASQYLWKTEITDYIALPSKKNCRWIIPTNPKLAKKAWDLYQPYSLKGGIYKHFNKSFVRINPFLYRKFIPVESLKNKLVEILGMDDIVMPISTGTPSPFRKITGIVMSSDGKPQACIKIGETPLAIERIKNEAKILKELAISNQLSAISIPKCVYEGEIGNGYLLIQSPAPFDGKSGGKYFNEDYENILHTIINNTSITKKFNESDFYKRLKEGIENYSLSYKDVLKNGLDHLENALGDKEITFALSHGDCAPWNMIWKEKEVFIYDWESANLEAPAGIDLVHFLFQTAFLLKKLRGEKLLRYLFQNASLPSLPLPIPEILVMLYSLHMAVIEDQPQQLSPAAVERRKLIKIIMDGD
jgi:thymidylate kinase